MNTPPNQKNSKNKRLTLLFLFLTTILWGTSFIITRTIVQETPVFLYMSLRFFVAVLGFTPYFLHLKTLNKQIIIAGFISGFLYFLGIATQTIGLVNTTAGKAGFITGLSTVMVPFLSYLMFKKYFKNKIWIAAFLSIFGLGFLFLEGEKGIILGDLWVLICAVFFALFIIYNDKYVNKMNVYSYSIVQLNVVAGLSLITSLIFGESFIFGSKDFLFWIMIIYMGLGVTTLTFLFQNWSQQYQGPATTAIIFALEPVFAALFGFIIGDEIITIFGWIGSILIFTAIILTVINKKEKKNEK
ncbi:MAG: EamA family transporter [Candidatus Lokiarchaeota archaeon]|nr:EamA family transporter [Candidatus Lokiarchaeota archaeon]MBD3200952.1 EamA family transporter [Candidatus Lokiarchaeota archaeon]